MNAFILAAADAADPGVGETLLGFLILFGLGWLIYIFFKPKGYDVEVHTKGTIRPR